MELGGARVVDDMFHACFECTARKDQLAAKGWARPPGGAGDFAQLFGSRSATRTGVRFLAAVSELVDGPTTG